MCYTWKCINNGSNNESFNASQGVPSASQRAPTAAPSQNASQRALMASERAPLMPSQSRSSEPVYGHEYTSSTRHLDFSSMRSRYGESSLTYQKYRSSPHIDGIGESFVSSSRIPSSPQIPSAQPDTQIRSPRIYEIDYLPSYRENENALTEKAKLVFRRALTTSLEALLTFLRAN